MNKTPKINQQRVDVLFKWIMFTAAITGMAMISAYYPLEANTPLIIIPSILVLIFAKPVLFEKLKLNTLVIMRILIILAVLNFIDKQWYVNLILWMLIINILEATFTDLLRHKQIFNAISGFAVALGVFSLSGTWAYGAPFGDYYVVNGVLPTITACYIIAYTIWNWTFVTYEFSPSVSLMHVGFLSAPLIGCLCSSWMGMFGGLGMWLILRANSLSIGGWLQIGAKQWFEKEYYSETMEKIIDRLHTTTAQIVVMIINLVLVGVCLYLAYMSGSISVPKLWA